MSEQLETILLVDDDEDILEVLERFLRRHRFQTVRALNGREAIEKMTEHRPSAVISDIHMPEVNGLELLKSLVRQDPNILVIITTGYPDVDNTISALRGGAADFLPKPFNLNELLKSLQTGLERRREREKETSYREGLEKAVEERTRQIALLLHDVAKDIGEPGSTGFESVEVLRRTSVLRDIETGSHLARVRLATGEVARELGLPESEVELIREASPMHDLGKIGIPDRILLKRGPLTPDEAVIMRRHTLIGAEILEGADSPVLRMSRVIALTHHERWDGAGYPNGLKGEDIPLAGRIVAVVDVFDALTHERCYKRASSVHETLEIMREQRGTRFDPRVFDAFLAALPRILDHEKRTLADESSARIKRLNTL